MAELTRKLSSAGDHVPVPVPLTLFPQSIDNKQEQVALW